MFGDAEVKVLEEGGDAREEADALDSAGFDLIEEGVNQQTAGPLSLGVGMDDDGADLGEMWAVDVERGTADEFVGVSFDDSKGGDAGADLRVTPGE